MTEAIRHATMPRMMSAMKILPIALLLLHASAFADVWECTDSGDGHVYRATQFVPVDSCVIISRTPESAESKTLRERFKIPLAERTTIPVIGMRKSDAMLSRWGIPDKVNKTTTASSTTEQWVYSGGRYLYFENDLLTAVQE